MSNSWRHVGKVGGVVELMGAVWNCRRGVAKKKCRALPTSAHAGQALCLGVCGLCRFENVLRILGSPGSIFEISSRQTRSLGSLGSLDLIFGVSGVAGPDFRDLQGRRTRFLRSPGLRTRFCGSCPVDLNSNRSSPCVIRFCLCLFGKQ